MQLQLRPYCTRGQPSVTQGPSLVYAHPRICSSSRCAWMPPRVTESEPRGEVKVMCSFQTRVIPCRFFIPTPFFLSASRTGSKILELSYAACQPIYFFLFFDAPWDGECFVICYNFKLQGQCFKGRAANKINFRCFHNLMACRKKVD